jgi:carbamoyltransferase
MNVLGIACYYHDSSATLLRDGVVVAAAEEERFSRKKHDHGFPSQAVNFCLRAGGIQMEDIDYVAFYERPILKFERVLSQHLQMFPWSLKTFLSSMPSWLSEKLRVRKIIRKKLRYIGPVVFVGHHQSHAAAAFLPSPFEKAAILTVDGVGEWQTTTLGIGEGSNVKLIREISFPHSLGLLYSTITAYLGFSVNNSEYKVMGLAPCGDMNRTSNSYYTKLKKVIDVKPDGSFHLDMKYFTFHFGDRMPSDTLCALLGGPIERRDAEMNRRHKDIAAALQLITEDVLTRILAHLHTLTKTNSVVLAGGVALNSVYNGKILETSPFEKVWIQPNASDGGSSMGAALFLWNSILKNERTYEMKSAYLGPVFSDDDIRSFLDENHIVYTRFSSDAEVARNTARLVFENQVVGWFQLGMEWGPRALGSRSIISNATDPKMQEILNVKVKHREKFRPFAPAVCSDDASTYFECDTPIPDPTDYMLMVYPIKEEFRNAIPAVTHVDGSGRLQTVHRYQNPLYYDLIKEFGKISGIPIIVNTSFNIRGEPIVCSPKDAYRCMMGTGIDCLVMGRYLIWRRENERDMWDSESVARD